MIADVLITFFLVFMNGFFVAAEFAIVKVRASQIEMKVEAGSRVAKLASHITTHLDGYLAATQLGITLASLGLGWIGEPVVSKLIIGFLHLIGVDIEPELAHDIALPVAFAIITVLHIVFGELAPKSVAIQRPEKTTLFIAYPLQFFYVIFKPFVWVLNGIANAILKLLGISSVHGTEVHSSDELKYLVQQGKESGEIESTDYDIIKNAFDFSERTARQVLIPRNQVVGIDVHDFNETILQKVIDESFSRIPVFENSLDHVIGVVYLKDMLLKLWKREPIEIREIMRPVMMVPETKRVGQLMKDFQLKRQQIAVVVNEYGGTKGIITMEDILEELVGEIQDEFDNETPVVEKVSQKEFIVLASASLLNVNEQLPRELEINPEEYQTLAGYLTHHSGRLLNVNEKVVSEDYEFTVLKKTRSTILMVRMVDLKSE